jgi:hypothetical protein
MLIFQSIYSLEMVSVSDVFGCFRGINYGLGFLADTYE